LTHWNRFYYDFGELHLQYYNKKPFHFSE
jgi:hypothetical protein